MHTTMEPTTSIDTQTRTQLNIEVTSRNGIDTGTQKNILDALAQQPARAAVTFKGTNIWEDGTASTTSVSGFSVGGQELAHRRPFCISSDMPVDFLGGAAVTSVPIT